MGPPKGLAQSEFIGVCRIRSTWACFDHISLIKLGIELRFFFDSLLIEEVTEKI